MEFSARHDFDRPVDEVWEMLLDPEGHVGKYELMGHRDITVLEVSRGEDSLDLKTIRTVVGEVPAMARKIIKSENTIVTTDRWERSADGLRTGVSQIEASNVPGMAIARATLVPAGDRTCTYSINLELRLKVPLIGDRFVALLRPQIMEIVDAEFEACDRWLARSATP